MALLCACAPAQQPAVPHAVFPPVTSYALDKSKVTLPGDLTGNLNVLLLFFRRDQQAQIDSWANEMRKLESTHGALKAYVLPVMPRENLLSRWWMNSSLRSGSSSQQHWHTTVPLYVDVPKFIQALGIGSERHAILLLTKKTGEVLWSSSGPATDASQAGLESAITAALSAR